VSVTRTTRVIDAPAETLYDAFLDRDALLQWLPPGNMTGRIHHFEPRAGGGYRMSLFYPQGENRGKASANEDSVSVRFVILDRPRRIVEAVTFPSADPLFAGEMQLEVTFKPLDAATEVTITCTNIPPGIRPEDNDEGARSSLEKLAAYVTSRNTTAKRA
jgi:uncharacterized protein YndB with AHSA1/START domain